MDMEMCAFVVETVGEFVTKMSAVPGHVVAVAYTGSKEQATLSGEGWVVFESGRVVE